MFRAPSTQSLMCFEASARMRSFTAAARELNLTQGAVSRQIQTLEERLGVPLFAGRRDAMALTDAGANTWLKLHRCCGNWSVPP